MASELDEVRQKFPEYATWSDQKLGRALKKKAQPDMSEEEYWGQLGIDPNGLTLGGQPFPQEESGQPNQPNPEETFGDKMENFYRASGIHGANKGFANIFGFGEHVKNANEAAKQAKETHPLATGAGEIAANIYGSVPFFMAGGGAARAIPGAAKAAPLLTKIAGAGIGGGALAGVQPVGEDETRLGNTLKGAGEAAAIEGLLGGVGKAINHLKPSAIIARKAGNAIPKSEIAENYRVARGTETPIGDILGSGYLKKAFENEIGPMSGEIADDALARVGQQLSERGQGVLNKLGKNAAGKDVNYDIKNVLTSAYKKQQGIKNTLYDEASKIAEKEGFELNLPSFSKVVKEAAKSIDESPLLKHDVDAKKIYNKIVNFQNPKIESKSTILGANGLPLPGKTTYPSIRDANFLASKFEEAAQQASSSPGAGDRSAAALYKNLASKLRGDVRKQIETKGSQALKDQFATSTANYKENFAPFLDKDIFKISQGSQEAENLVNEIIRPGKADRFKRIEKIQSLLPDDKKDLLGFEYLGRAVDKTGRFDPSKMATLSKNLGKRQFEALFPNPETRKAISDYEKLVKLNPEAALRLFNPKTGQRAITPIQSNTKSIGTTVGAVGGWMGGGGTLGSLAGSALGAYAGKKVPELVSRNLAKKFTSEAFRDKVVESLFKIKNQAPSSAKKDILATALKRGLAPSAYSENE